MGRALWALRVTERSRARCLRRVARQAAIFAEAGVDLVAAITMTYAEEAVGIVRAAQAVGLPVVISFTTETDGRLPSGQTLSAAISRSSATAVRWSSSPTTDAPALRATLITPP